MFLSAYVIGTLAPSRPPANAAALGEMSRGSYGARTRAPGRQAPGRHFPSRGLFQSRVRVGSEPRDTAPSGTQNSRTRAPSRPPEHYCSLGRRLQDSGPWQADPEQTFPQRRYVLVQSLRRAARSCPIRNCSHAHSPVGLLQAVSEASISNLLSR